MSLRHGKLERRVGAMIIVLMLVFVLPLAAETPAHRSLATQADSTPDHSNAAVDAFFRSDLSEARAAAQNVTDSKTNRATAHSRNGASASAKTSLAAQADALFIEMQAATLQANIAAELEAAVRLCELRLPEDDARATIAENRVATLASNTDAFRAVIPRLRALLQAGSAQSPTLRIALLSAAMDGVNGLSVAELAREAGVITDWKIVGPFGDYPNTAFERVWAPDGGAVWPKAYPESAVESFHFDSGKVVLPDYLSQDGVFYATAVITANKPGNWRVRLESLGTLQVAVDGITVLAKDDRFEQTPRITNATAGLSAGSHTVLVKFLPSAAPFRIAVLPPVIVKSATGPVPTEIDSDYLKAAAALEAADYTGALKLGTALLARQKSAAVDWLIAKAWQREGQAGPEAKPLLKAASDLAPSAWAVEHELALERFQQGKPEDAAALLQHVVTSAPQYWPSWELLSRIAARAIDAQYAPAVEKAAELHPSCANLESAAKYFWSKADFERARQYEARLRDCAPNSLAHAKTLAERGDHRQAVAELKTLATTDPLNREAGNLLVHELLLAGQHAAAREEAHSLVPMAPNSARFERYAARLDAGDELLDADNADTEFAQEQRFYTPYRQDGTEVAKTVLPGTLKDNSATVLLDDRIARIHRDGSTELYVHTVTRVFDNSGIARFGEVAIPDNADLLELRTIKADGNIREPERTASKSTVSMTGLTPGDAIDVEYVLPDAAVAADAVQLTFGSFVAPIREARLVVISPEGAAVQFLPNGNVPTVGVQLDGRMIVRTWEKRDIAKATSENSMAPNVLPSVQVFTAERDGWAGVRDYYRDEFISASRVTARVSLAAEPMLKYSSEESRLRAIYRFVTTRLHSSTNAYDGGDFATADSTLANFDGNRTAAFLALSHAAGIDAEVLMARATGTALPSIPSIEAYTRPLVVARIGGKDVVLDLEAAGIGFGGIGANIETGDALTVPIYKPTAEPLIAAVPKPLVDNQSLADGDITFDRDGSLTAHLTIRMGASRGAEMRTMFRTMEEADRKHYFEQLAGRIFSGASDVKGEVRNETDTDNPLELIVDCRVPHFVEFNKGKIEIRQLVPELGLKKMYVTQDQRSTPMLIGTPLVETSRFRIHLPDGVTVAALGHDVISRTRFGSYSVSFRRIDDNVYEVERTFDIPVQVINPARYASFADFARQIDNAEQQKVVLAVGRDHS